MITFRASSALDCLRPQTNVVDDGSFKVGKTPVPALSVNLLLQTREFIKLDCQMTRLDYRDTNKQKSLDGSTFVDAGPNEGHEGEA